MPSVNMAEEAIATAEWLCSRVGGRVPTEMDLRRAVSTAYYDMFHATSAMCANAMHGTNLAIRSNKEWAEMIRCLSHGETRRACLSAANVAFPPEIHEFAQVFVQLHDARIAADYNPMVVVNEREVLNYVSQAEKAIAGLDAVSPVDQKAFATWIMVQTQGARDSRQRMREGRETEL